MKNEIWLIEKIIKQTDEWTPIGYPIFTRDEAGKVLEEYQSNFPKSMYRIAKWHRVEEGLRG